MKAYKIFIIEDDPWYAATLEYHLALNPDYDIHVFTNAADCLKNLHLIPDLITIDFSLPDMRGDQLFIKIASICPALPVIIISGQEDISIAVELLKLGVNDYLVKNENTKELLWNIINKIRTTQSLQEEVQQLRKELCAKHDFSNSLKGQSAVLTRAFELMEKAAATSINVSISGESGTGKELVAKAIHYNSSRRAMRFEAINMAAIPSGLAESELFGHEKGAYTGALIRKKGKFEEANGGTIFLDEIAEMELSLQSKILRVLQERELVRLGGTETIKLDIRIIAATHRNLAEEVKKGNFREDLYYRLIGLPIQLPPLRERGNDILLLAQHFLNAFTMENNLSGITINAAAKDKLMRFSYPGNVRELKAIIELAAVMCSNEVIGRDDIILPPENEWEVFNNTEQTLKEYNNSIIKKFLKKYNNDVTLVSKKLDIGRSTIYKMIKTGALVI